ncbi:GNAT family N-acetyltransferase [Secundilactobacillus kimchicus]|uniref:GNAT family N-acetyltransferase n=1 Tax=Secundilactobacillus kimchicus TaxID=528209 RepID=UPI0024A897B3|nr:GNAT family N-acetyltransferase [Secundilactobacillus kimchicus]
MLEPVIQTSRLTLRAFLESDLEDYYEIVNNPEAARKAGFHYARDLQEARYLLMQSLRSQSVFAVVETRTQKVIGSIGLYDHLTEAGDVAETERELGYMLNAAFWNRGYMTEAGQAVLTYAKQTLQLTTVWASFLEDNVASKHVLTKLGFTYVDTYHHPPMAIYLPNVTELFYKWEAN